MAGLEAHYSARDIETKIMTALRTVGLDPDQGITPEQLGALDHFHTGGFKASRELQELAQICAADRVLDIGAGLAGAARMLAHSPGCSVDCIELTSDYCTGAVLLNRLTGLDGRINVHQGSALDLPFPDDTFDVVWMQNVGMNIADKRTLYAEVCRVLKPGGRFAFQEMAAGKEDATFYYPLPWATEPADNLLITIEAMHSVLGECGLTAETFEDVSDMILNSGPVSVTPVSAPPASTAPAQLGLSVFVDNLAEKAGNARRSLQEGQTRFVRGVFLAKV
ncbi:MAG: class I SAM-dependent methyltransferase [Gallionella sp.]|nr:class I SAM-dependent methyltransferase [Gallionella sp.]